MSTQVFASNEATSIASVANVDMKLEVIVIHRFSLFDSTKGSSTQADVTEGSGGIWERLHYDWSDPNHVVLTTTDSNLTPLKGLDNFRMSVVPLA
jgi:hypothetical protein